MASSSSSGLTFKLHPLVIVNISDHYTRVKSQMHPPSTGSHSHSNVNININGPDGATSPPLPSTPPPRVYGCVIGVQRGRTVEIFNSFELLYDPSTHSLDRPFSRRSKSSIRRFSLTSNVAAVNEALNGIYVEEEDYDRLRESIDLHDNFDQIGLAQKIEKHELLEMRRVAAYIYKKAGRWKQSIALSKKDTHYKDAMETASQSGERELAEELLVYFIEQGKKECFASCLFVCYDLIRSDIVFELAWMNNMLDFAFPYLLQFIREYTGKVDELVKDRIESLNEVKAKEKEEKDVIAQQNMYAQLLPLALPAPPMPGMGGAPGMGGFAPPPMGGMGMPPMPPYGMPPMGSSY